MHLFPGRTSYCLVFAVALADIIWIAMSDIAFPVRQLAGPAFVVSFSLLAIVAIDRFPCSNDRAKAVLEKFGYLFQGIIFLQIAWIAIRTFNHLSMTSALPYADGLLLAWDRLTGLNWEAYYHFVKSSGFLAWLMQQSYTSLTSLSFAGFLILMLQGDLKRTRFFLETFLFTAIACALIGMFFPAKAAVAMYHGDAATLANLATLPGVYHIEHLERLRNGMPVALDLNNMPGLVTFPSFHTAAGVILVASFWRTVLFPFVLAYSAIMIASTPVLGGHYFVDLIAGAAVAVLVVRVFGSLPFYDGMFGQVNGASASPETAAAKSPGATAPA